MKLLRETIRRIILESIQNNAAVENLNALIDTAKEKEVTWDEGRWGRDDPYEEAPDDDWGHITELMYAFDWVNNPPRELKCWFIVELPDGEIINKSKWQSYDQVLAMAQKIGYIPCDRDGNPTDEPEENGCELYFIYEDGL